MKPLLNLQESQIMRKQNLVGDSSKSAEFLESIQNRRSVRKFSQSPVRREIIDQAIMTATCAPSGANSQPWFFAVIESQSMKDQIRLAAEDVEWDFYNRKAPESWLKDLAPLGTNHSKPYLSEAPYIIAVFSRHFTKNLRSQDPQKSYYPIESTGIAVGFLLAALHQAGLGTLTHTPKPMGFLNQILDLDSTYRPYLMVVTGETHSDALYPNIEKKNFGEISKTY